MVYDNNLNTNIHIMAGQLIKVTYLTFFLQYVNMSRGQKNADDRIADDNCLSFKGNEGRLYITK